MVSDIKLLINYLLIYNLLLINNGNDKNQKYDWSVKMIDYDKLIHKKHFGHSFQFNLVKHKQGRKRISALLWSA